MSHPASEPAHEQRVNQASVPPGALFSHPPTAQAREQRRPPRGEHVDWRATPFSAGRRANITVDGQPIPADQQQPAADLDQRHPGAADLTGPRLLKAYRPPHRSCPSREGATGMTEVDKDKILQILRDRGEYARAQWVDRQLPQRVDLDKNAGLLAGARPMPQRSPRCARTTRRPGPRYTSVAWYWPTGSRPTGT